MFEIPIKHYQKYKDIYVTMPSDQIIREEDWKTITDMNYFDSTVDKEELDKFILDLPFYVTLESPNELRFSLRKFLCRNKEVFGLRHCDTQEYSNRWRIQIHINVRVFPEVLQLLTYKGDKTWQIGLAGGDLVMLTFSISKSVS